ncbi:MAG: superoxide dismutase [Flavobacteriales bacterium]|nr:superoxide dismutase [Flavobacteriales bacterium]|tara:strand:+ start:18346 stop:18939 length:594 start_codon:yes stop_codon:yes gene_type:complete
MSFELPKLSYSYDALEPHIDARTMEIHHSKHHAGYTTKLNVAIEGTSYVGQSIETILASELSPGLRNNGGGYYNHCLFWSIISPNGGGRPSGKLADAINSTFGSFEEFKSVFSSAAATQFGSGWAWLCAKNGKLSVCSTPNQDNPLMKSGCGNIPILGIDVWEHAYYLKYQNRRPDYIEAFFNIVDWNEVSRRYSEA